MSVVILSSTSMDDMAGFSGAFPDKSPSVLNEISISRSRSARGVSGVRKPGEEADEALSVSLLGKRISCCLHCQYTRGSTYAKNLSAQEISPTSLLLSFSCRELTLGAPRS